MIGKTPRRWPSAKAQSEISEPNPYRARHRQPQIIDDGMQPKPTIFALSRACIARGTGSSNPSPSSGESANFRFRETDDVKSIEIVDIEPALGEVAYFG
jgi:hypothetical protein